MEVLAGLPDNSIDAVVTDPPYHLTSIVKRFGKTSQADDNITSDRARRGADGIARLSRGFMGKQWDGGDIAFRPELWAEVLRVLKPGGHMVAFSGTRTYHRMAVAIEDAGFEIRDQIGWCFGSGFPKSHNIGNGWGTALKPAWEPICLARKPLSEATVAANVLRWGTGALNIDATRIANGGDEPRGLTSKLDTNMHEGWARPWMEDRAEVQKRHDDAIERANSLGRWPANLCHDGSPEVLAGFPETTSAVSSGDNFKNSMFAGGRDTKAQIGLGNSGSAARYFYTAKADWDDRLKSKHPTVKPVDLMQWLVRMVCPKGGRVLDPFAGTGTTGAAAWIEGCRAVLIERESEYQADIERRMELLLSGPDERSRKLTEPEPYEFPPAIWWCMISAEPWLC